MKIEIDQKEFTKFTNELPDLLLINFDNNEQCLVAKYFREVLKTEVLAHKDGYYIIETKEFFEYPSWLIVFMMVAGNYYTVPAIKAKKLLEIVNSKSIPKGSTSMNGYPAVKMEWANLIFNIRSQAEKVFMTDKEFLEARKKLSKIIPNLDELLDKEKARRDYIEATGQEPALKVN